MLEKKLTRASYVLAVTTVVAICSAAAAEAATVSVDGDRWRISTVEGTFADLQTTLEAQTWWEDESRANAFADALGDALGFPNFGQAPWFAWDVPTDETRFLYTARSSSPAPGGGLNPINGNAPQTLFRVYATAAPVPLPAGGALLLSGLGILAARRRVA